MTITSVAAACGAQLGAARQFYRTEDSTADLEAVRQALGAPALSLVGVSYGGRVLGEYARRFPAGVARLVLDSPEVLSGINPYNLQQQAALPRVLSTVCGGGACRAFTRSPYGDLTRLVARLRHRPLRGRAIDQRGHAHRLKLTLPVLFGLVENMDENALARAELPAADASALRGDPAPLLRLAAPLLSKAGGAPKSDLNFALLFATACAESPLPWDPASSPAGPGRALLAARAIRALGPRAFAPWGPKLVLGPLSGAPILEPCLKWPSVVKPPTLGGTAPEPALVLSGQEDLRTPQETSRQVLAGYPQGRLLSIPFTGHSTITSDPNKCALAAAVLFIRSGAAPAACPVAKRVPSLAPLAPRSLRDVPARGARGARGRTLAGVRLTLSDAIRQGTGSLRAGGLRGGRLVVNLKTRSVRLLGYTYIRCLSVTGTLHVRRDHRMTGRVRVLPTCRGPVPAIIRVLPSGRLLPRFPVRGRRAAAASSVASLAGVPLLLRPAPPAPPFVGL